jgi:hypothetical protein
MRKERSFRDGGGNPTLPISPVRAENTTKRAASDSMRGYLTVLEGFERACLPKPTQSLAGPRAEDHIAVALATCVIVLTDLGPILCPNIASVLGRRDRTASRANTAFSIVQWSVAMTQV